MRMEERRFFIENVEEMVSSLPQGATFLFCSFSLINETHRRPRFAAVHTPCLRMILITGHHASSHFQRPPRGFSRPFLPHGLFSCVEIGHKNAFRTSLATERSRKSEPDGSQCLHLGIMKMGEKQNSTVNSLILTL